MTDEDKLYGVVDKITGKLVDVASSGEEVEILAKEKYELKKILWESYEEITSILRYYLDIKESFYPLITYWIIGTYFHEDFSSYPYLFFNAMRGSGKTRTLGLITELSKDGEMMTSPTEAVLFRTTGTLGIDEFEGVANKDKSSIRELLNSGYKKGMTVKRLKKKKTLDGEQQVVETFDTYRPIVMANIWGMDEVLGDRCISLTLEKSNHPLITRLVENFSSDKNIQKIRENLNKFTNQCRLCRDVMVKNIKTSWNSYLSNRYKTSLTTLTTYNTLTTQTSLELLNKLKFEKFFNKIHDTEIIGRNLELFLPLFIISYLIDEKNFVELIDIAKELTFEKKHEEETESYDVLVYDFVSQQDSVLEFLPMKDIFMVFKQFLGDYDQEWVNIKWFGRALKRLNLVVDKRKMGHGRQVILNVNKALEKIKIFRTEKKDGN